MDSKLKSLKVAELKAVLVQAGEVAPAKATKADLIARILASEVAQDAYRQLYDDPVAEEEAEAEVEAATTEGGDPEPVVAEEVVSAEPAKVEEAKKGPEGSVDAELEARKRRAERFGIPLVEPKAPRAPKPKQAAKQPKPQVDPSTLTKRAERFGIKRAAPADAIDPEEAERRKKRAERFGIKG